MNTLLNREIAIEVNLPEPLFRELQQALDRHPKLSFDDLASHAFRLYLDQHLADQ